MRKILCIAIIFIVSSCIMLYSTKEPELKKIYFGYWKPSMTNPKDLKENIIKIKECVKKYPQAKLELVGHAGRDFKKPFDYKQKLIDMSLIRAKAIEKELIANGIPKDKICSVSGVGYKYAKAMPKDFKDEESYKQVNQFDRYVEIMLTNCNKAPFKEAKRAKVESKEIKSRK